MNKILFLLVGLLVPYGIYAQTITDYFKVSPAQIFQAVDSISRINMCDFAKAGKCTAVVTSFGDSVIVRKSVNDKFMAFSYSNTDVQIKLIDDVIVVAQTIGNEYKNSQILFYDTDWKLKSTWIYGARHSKMMPSDKNIFDYMVVKPDSMSNKDFNRIKLYFDPMLVSAELIADVDEIVLTSACPLLSDEEKRQIKSVVKQKTFKWTNGRFK